MIRLKPFRALRPRPGDAARVASVPYDVVNAAEARTLAEGNPLSFLHVIRPEIDLPESTDPHSPEVYARAKHEFERFKRDVFVRDEAPCVYLYRQEADLPGKRVSQTGVVACCHVDDYLNNLIRKHEKTRRDKEDDRTRHVLTLNANAEPVFLLFKDHADIQRLIDAGSVEQPMYDFTAPDGVRHTVWRAADSAAFVDAFRGVAVVYVADGHHRTAAAARAGVERRRANPLHTGAEEYNWFLAVLFPASALTILPYHRVVADLNGMTPEQFVERLRRVGAVTEDAPPEPPRPHCVSVCVRNPGKGGGRWYGLEFPPETILHDDLIRGLDCEILYNRVLAPILGIEDIRTDKRIDFIGGIRGPGALVEKVSSGEAAVAFSMFPVTIDQLTAIADAGAIMPPKSTWFEPKLRSGLLVHELD